ncbi:MAG: class II aldolase/adducin family protein [Pseudomonadota bacterium]
MSHPSLYQELRTVSASVGREPLLVQGGGGNSSVKALGRLLVKASGHWMADAEDTDMFAVLDLQEAKTLAMAGAADFSPAVRGDTSLKPSIETAMHALMPQRCVLHAHPIGVIVRTLIGGACGDIPVVPYTKPGQPLAEALKALLDNAPVNTVILANHGIIVGGKRPAIAEARLRETCATLDLPARAFEMVSPDLPVLPGYAALDHPLATALACDDTAVAALTSGALVPDQVVYLGGGGALARTVYSVPSVIAEFGETTGTLPGLIVLEGHGLYLREGLRGGAAALADMLVQIALRIPKGRQVVPLTPADEAELRNWDAEAHRKIVDASRKARPLAKDIAV